jgi:hypothetical protein
MKLRSRSSLLTLIPVLLLAGLLAACAQAKGGPAGGQPSPFPTPLTGKSSLAGRLLGQKDGAPLAKVTVRLAKIYRQGDQAAYVLDLAHSPSNVSDENGYFIVQDFDPDEYYMVIGEPGDNHYYIIQDSKQEGVIYKVAKDQVLDAGAIRADFTP